MIEHLLQYGYVFVFVGVVFEGDATLIAAAILAHRGHFSLAVVLGVAVLASFITDEVFYVLAKKRGQSMFEGKSLENERLARIRRWVKRHGVLLMLFSRFIWGFRVAIPAACGAIGMRRAKFTLLNVAGALLWAIPLGFGGYGIARFFARFFSHLGSQQGLMALALAGAAIVAVIWHRRDLHDEAEAIAHPDQFAIEAAEEIFEENHTHAHHSKLLALIPEENGTRGRLSLPRLPLRAPLRIPARHRD